MRFTKNDLFESVKQLEGLHESMLDLLFEMKDKIQFICAETNSKIIKERAESYWIPRIENNLTLEVNCPLGSMINFGDTLESLKEAIECSDAPED